METINNIINFWLQNGRYIEKFKKYYDNHPKQFFDDGKEPIFDFIKDRLNVSKKPIYSDDHNRVYFDYSESVAYIEKAKAGCYITSVEGGKGIDVEITVEYNGSRFQKHINDIFNEHLGETYFTDKLYQDRCDYFSLYNLILDTLRDIELCSRVYLCKPMYRFYTETNFVRDFVEITHNQVDVRTVRPLKADGVPVIEECGYTAKYNSRERFFNAEKKFGKTVIGYNFAFLDNMLESINYAYTDKQKHFSSTALEIYVQLFVSEQVNRLRVNTVREFQLLMYFILGYTDKLGEFFMEEYGDNS